MIAALGQPRDTATETVHIRDDAARILNSTVEFESVAMLFFWSMGAFSPIDRIQKRLQAQKQIFIKHSIKWEFWLT